MGLFGHHGWLSKNKHLANPVHLVTELVTSANKATGWKKPGDGLDGVDLSVHYNTAIDENMINQAYASQELSEINNKSETWEEYANNLQDAKYISQTEKDKALQQANGGTTMANTATNTQEQNWFERNSEYIMPLLSTALTTAAQMYYNDRQQDKQNSFNAEQAEINREYNSAEAEKNRQWQENMSNTAITRQVSDLQSAGINPLLASQLGGSAITSGATASGTPATSAGLMGMNMKDMINTARTGAEIQNMQADTRLKEHQSGKTNAEITYTEVMTGINSLKAPLERAVLESTNTKQKSEVAKALKELNKIEAETAKAHSETDLNKAKQKIEEWEGRHPILSRVLPGGTAMVGAAMGGALGGPLGAMAGGMISNISKKPIGFNR